MSLVDAQAQVRQKQAALVQAEVDLRNTFIRAPVDGIVVSRNVDVGQTVAASLQAPTLFLIAQDLTKMQVDTNVDEADIGRVALDQEATFTVDSYPGQTFRGRVVQIRQAPQVIQNVVTYNTVVAVSNPDLKLKPGMTANVKLLVARRENALLVPNAAFRFRLDNASASSGGSLDRRDNATDHPPGRIPHLESDQIVDVVLAAVERTARVLGDFDGPAAVSRDLFGRAERVEQRVRSILVQPGREDSDDEDHVTAGRDEKYRFELRKAARIVGQHPRRSPRRARRAGVGSRRGERGVRSRPARARMRCAEACALPAQSRMSRMVREPPRSAAPIRLRIARAVRPCARPAFWPSL